MKPLLCVAAAAGLLALAAPADALDRTLPGQVFGPISPDTITIRKPGSTGDISRMGATPTGSGVSLFLGDLINWLRPHVATNAALKTSGTWFNSVRRNGFSTAGDGGAGDYLWSGSNCVNPDDGMQVQPTGRTGCWMIEPTAVVTPYLYGAKGNGTTDDTAPIQAALYGLCNRGAGELYVPGRWLMSSLNITCNGISIRGSGNSNVNSGNLDYRNTVFISTPNNAGTMFKYTSSGGANYGSGFSLSEFGVDGTGQTIDGWAFDISYLLHARVYNISLYKPANVLKSFGGGGNMMQDVSTLLQRGVGVDYSGDASQCGGTNASLAGCNKRADLLRLNRVTFLMDRDNQTARQICVNWHDFAQSLNTDHVICEDAYIGMNVYCSANQGNNGNACPSFGRHVAWESENCFYRCLNISDAQDQEFFGAYVLGGGINADIPIAVYNTNFPATSTNSATGAYTQAFRWHGGRAGNAKEAIMRIAVSDFIVQGSHFFSGNLKGTGGVGNIEVDNDNGDTYTVRGTIFGNILCSASGQQPLGLTQAGVTLRPNVDYIKTGLNVVQQCAGTNGINDYSGMTHNMLN